jgi:hypothetical protein
MRDTLLSPADARRFLTRELGVDPTAWEQAMELAAAG